MTVTAHEAEGGGRIRTDSDSESILALACPGLAQGNNHSDRPGQPNLKSLW